LIGLRETNLVERACTGLDWCLFLGGLAWFVMLFGSLSVEEWQQLLVEGGRGPDLSVSFLGLPISGLGYSRLKRSYF